jgi:hypothetical protein
MSKDIQTGINKTIEALNRRQTDELNAGWRDLRNKLDSMLLATNVLKSNDAMRSCRALDTMTSQERSEHILRNWGPQYLEKAKPILIQLEMVEKRIQQS